MENLIFGLKYIQENFDDYILDSECGVVIVDITDEKLNIKDQKYLESLNWIKHDDDFRYYL
jgi:hypothetical protein